MKLNLSVLHTESPIISNWVENITVSVCQTGETASRRSLCLALAQHSGCYGRIRRKRSASVPISLFRIYNGNTVHRRLLQRGLRYNKYNIHRCHDANIARFKSTLIGKEQLDEDTQVTTVFDFRKTLYTLRVVFVAKTSLRNFYTSMHTNGHAYARVASVCLSVVCNVCIVTKRCVLPKICLKKQIGNGLYGIEW